MSRSPMKHDAEQFKLVSRVLRKDDSYVLEYIFYYVVRRISENVGFSTIYTTYIDHL